MSDFSFLGGVGIMGFISPKDTTDTYAVIDPLYGIDGLRNVDLLSDLDTITTERRRVGMVVGTNSGSTYYKLKSEPWTYTFSDWELFFVGITGGTFNDYTLTLSSNDGSSIVITGLTDYYVTSGDFNNNTLTLNRGNGSLAVTGFTDYYVTGGTYSNGTLTLNRGNGSISISGFLTGSSSNSSTSGSSLPIVRNVYLVQDTSDAIRMGGSESNAYTTFQSAYDAANTLQTTKGGRVVIMVGNVSAGTTTTATMVGDCFVSSWNNNISLAGINRQISTVGSIIITGTTAASIIIQNLTVGRGNISQASYGGGGESGILIWGGGITLTLENSHINRTVSTIRNGGLSGVGNSGAVTINNSFNSTIAANLAGTVGGISMSSSSGSSANFSMTNCSNLNIGSINQVSSSGSCGSFTMINCSNMNIPIVQRQVISPTNTVTMGNFSMLTCNNIRYSTLTNTFNTKSLSNENITGNTINFNIDRTNSSILFAGTVTLGGITNINNSDVGLWVRLYNCEFIGGLLINGNTNQAFGGFLKNLDMERCSISSFYIWNLPIKSQVGDYFSSPNRVFIHNCKQNLFGADSVFKIVNYGVSYNNFVIKNYTSDEAFPNTIGTSTDSYGYFLINLNTTFDDYTLYSASTVSFMTTGESIILDNVNVKGYLGVAGLDPETSSNSGTTVNCYISNSSVNALELYSGWGNFNYRIDNSNVKPFYSTYLSIAAMYGSANYINGGQDEFGSFINGTLTKPIYIYNSNIPFNYQSKNPNFSGFGIIGKIPFVIENSYVELGSIVDSTNNPYGGDIILNKVYNSHIVGKSNDDFGGGTATINSISGTVYTTTLTRPSTTLITGVTFYNSYDDVY